MQSFLELLRNIVPTLLQGTVCDLADRLMISLLLGVAVGLPCWYRACLPGRAGCNACSVTSPPSWGTPLLIQLFWLDYGLPDLGITFGRLTAATSRSGSTAAPTGRSTLPARCNRSTRADDRGACHRHEQGPGDPQHHHCRRRCASVLPAWSNKVIAMLENTAVVYGGCHPHPRPHGTGQGGQQRFLRLSPSI